MRDFRYTRQIEITLKSHEPLTEVEVERFVALGFWTQLRIAPSTSEMRDVGFVIDDIGQPVAI